MIRHRRPIRTIAVRSARTRGRIYLLAPRTGAIYGQSVPTRTAVKNSGRVHKVKRCT